MSVLTRKSRLAKRASRSDTNAPPPAEPQGRRVNAAPTSTTRPSAVIAPVRRLPPSPPTRPTPNTISIRMATPISRANGVIVPSGQVAGARLSRASGEESQENGNQAALDGGERERRQHPEEDQDEREERERDPLRAPRIRERGEVGRRRRPENLLGDAQDVHRRQEGADHRREEPPRVRRSPGAEEGHELGDEPRGRGQ